MKEQCTIHIYLPKGEQYIAVYDSCDFHSVKNVYQSIINLEIETRVNLLTLERILQEELIRALCQRNNPFFGVSNQFNTDGN